MASKLSFYIFLYEDSSSGLYFQIETFIFHLFSLDFHVEGTLKHAVTEVLEVVFKFKIFCISNHVS